MTPNAQLESARKCLNVEFQLKIGFISPYLQGPHGDNLSAVESADEFIATDPQLALAGLDLMVLHSARSVGNGAVNPVAMDRNRGGDVPHGSVISDEFAVQKGILLRIVLRKQ